MATFTSCPPYGSHGPWANQVHHYLGLTFILKGKVHYGWARLDVSVINAATLTGYAYETVPNKAIIAGQTKGPDVIKVSDTLGGLAKGAVNHRRKVGLPKPH